MSQTTPDQLVQYWKVEMIREIEALSLTALAQEEDGFDIDLRLQGELKGLRSAILIMNRSFDFLCP